ncbi:MAG: hypothetical protein Q9218_006551 [Villophora microphyllina]
MSRLRPAREIPSRRWQCLARRTLPPYVRPFHTHHPKPNLRNQLRFQSTTTSFTTSQIASRSLITRINNLVLGTAIGLSLILGYYYVTDTRASIHEWLIIPCLRYFYPDAEDAHEFGNRALKALYSFGLHPRERGYNDAKGDLAVEVFGHMLQNPLGTSAGIDKHCDIPDALLAAGAAIVEIGGVTAEPQEGNDRPRVFRIPSHRALVNRYGLNSEGADHVAMRLRQRVREYAYQLGFGIDEEAEQRVLDGEAGVPPGSLQEGKLVAVQIAKNKWTPEDDVEATKRDYVYCVNALAKYADVIVVNVSSPNTPGLRHLQKSEPLTDILTAVVEAARNVRRKTPPAVMVKVSPDEDGEDDVRGVCDAVVESGAAGVICGNTTKRRDPLPSGMPQHERLVFLEQGGYSGPQTFDRTVALVRRYRRVLDDRSYHASEPPSPQPHPSNNAETRNIASPVQAPEVSHPPTTYNEIEATVARDAQHLKPDTPEAEAESKNQSLFRIPERHKSFSSSTTTDETHPSPNSSTQSQQQLAASPSTDTTPSPSISPTTSPSSSSSPPASSPSSSAPSTHSSRNRTTNNQRKVIFATGGISSGSQALEVLSAGADVVQIYTALVYGGIGTISKIKEGMRDELRKHQNDGKRR